MYDKSSTCHTFLDRDRVVTCQLCQKRVSITHILLCGNNVRKWVANRRPLANVDNFLVNVLIQSTTCHTFKIVVCQLLKIIYQPSFEVF